MCKKILYCATVDYHFKAFHLPYMEWFQKQGWEVHVAAKGNMELPFCNKKYDLPIDRNPLKTNNLKAYKELKKIIDENDYDIIHAHTPMGGMLTRLAAKTSRKKGTKVVYTAHGFHFCKGAPLRNWVMYYPLERWLASYTDCLITINNEDYAIAKKHKFKAGRIDHVHGVGVDTEKFHPVNEEEKNAIRKRKGYKKEDFLIYYAAELNKNKNQGFLIKVLAKAKEKIPSVRLLLIGEGNMIDFYKSMAKELGVGELVDFLGFRKDVDEIGKMSDIAVASSEREGLPVNIMEAMACGKPVIASDNRGHRELIQDNINGYIIKDNSEIDFVEKLCEIYELMRIGNSFKDNSVLKIEKYALNNIRQEMSEVYKLLMQ